MNNLTNHKIFKLIKQNSDVLIGLVFILVIALIIIPLPPFLLDLALTLNISLAVIILMMTIFSKSVLDFSVFPTLLLVTTLFRLALNISSTRLILSTGNPGEVVTSFGQFVTQGDIVVGSVIFIIIVIVQFLVITNGSSRVAEVAARFTLDAMPGKQMSIDADLNSGLINEEQARRRRHEIQVEAEFYGAMDGASKFVKGDAIAGIIVVLINFIGGILIFTMKGYGAMDAMQKFGLLTIGDGLVSQVPALLISVASGIIVTRTASENNLGQEVSRQMLSIPKTIAITSGVLFIFALVPGLPFVPFMILSVAAGVTAYLLIEGEKTNAQTEQQVDLVDVEPDLPGPVEEIGRYVNVEVFEIEFGYALIPLVDNESGDDVLERILQVRRQLANEIGLVVQPIRLRDNLMLNPNEYVIKIKGNTVGRGEVYHSQYLVMNPFGDEILLDGIDTVEPAFGLKAKWVNERLKSKAEDLGYTTVDDCTVLITHMKELMKSHSHELLGRQDVKAMIESLKERQPSVVEDVIPELVSLGDLQKILKNLLKENVNIRDLATILETLADFAPTTKDSELLTEYVRHRLNRSIVQPYTNEFNGLEVLTIDPTLEELISNNIQRSFQGSFPALAPDVTTRVFQSIQHHLDIAMMQQKNPVILSSPKIRPAFRKLIEMTFPFVPVLSLNDVPNHVEIEVIGMVSLNAN
ncbi:MAG TPA: flagellar biosynthesis protein FlhA [Firmicutes bacterium]|nr:flagellar biosynthesis protein FlhA [Bacillota bacterium]